MNAQEEHTVIDNTFNKVFPSPVETAKQLQKNTEQMGAYMIQLGQLMINMQKRLDDMEAQQRKITLSHSEVRTVQQLIRNRAYEYCEKYEMMDKSAIRSISNGIKRAILARYGVKDLHDVPAVARQAVEAQISRWSDVRLMMKCRERLRAGGP